jgi:DNA polymerase-3 subunit gamma/tau
MSYQVLARKWRPRRFAELVGQEHVQKALINALDRDRLHHASLFTGTRGVGKTTIARILAKSLNCEQGVSSQPCGACSACQEVDAGRFVDLIEIDAASNTGVDDMRGLIENAQYAPARGRYKVYLIDEVHMLSKSAFNALLKTLEEPPPHVKFLLATTDPQKLPITILSRCLQFNLKRLPTALIAQHLDRILAAEQVQAEAGAVADLARAADGSLRDALSLLDQAIAYGGGRLTEAEVRTMLGTIDRKRVFELLGALADADAAGVLAIVADLDQQAPDWDGVLDDLAAALQRLAILHAVPGAGADWDDKAQLAALVPRLAPEETQLLYQIAVTSRRDLGLAPDPRAGFEMALLRMLAFRPLGDLSQQDAAPAAAPARSAPRPPPREDAAPAAAPATRAAPPAPITGSAAPSGEWGELVAGLGLEGPAARLAAHCAQRAREGDTFHLTLAPVHAALNTPKFVERLTEALAQRLGGPVRVRIEIAEPAAETPAQRAAREDAAKLEGARERLARDPNIAALTETFGARLEPDSVRPTD